MGFVQPTAVSTAGVAYSEFTLNGKRVIAGAAFVLIEAM